MASKATATATATPTLDEIRLRRIQATVTSWSDQVQRGTATPLEAIAVIHSTVEQLFNAAFPA